MANKGPRSRSTASESLSAPPAERARAEACRLLARAPRSAAEVDAHLAGRGFAPSTIAATLQALRDLRYIDDTMLARRCAEDLLLRRGCGRLKVAHELTRRGVADNVVTTAVAAVLEERGETELARRALARRFGELPLESIAERARAFRFLTGRGHPADIVNDILQDDT